MELVPDYNNVHFIDEYPELEKRLWLRRLAKSRLGESAAAQSVVLELPKPPDGAA